MRVSALLQVQHGPGNLTRGEQRVVYADAMEGPRSAISADVRR